MKLGVMVLVLLVDSVTLAARPAALTDVIQGATGDLWQTSHPHDRAGVKEEQIFTHGASDSGTRRVLAPLGGKEGSSSSAIEEEFCFAALGGKGIAQHARYPEKPTMSLIVRTQLL